MGTLHSDVSYPVCLNDFVYETPGNKRTYVQVRRPRKAPAPRESSEEFTTKSKVCRQIIFGKVAKKRSVSSGVPHQWMPTSGQLNKIWCTKKKRARRIKNAYPRPIAFLFTKPIAHLC